MKRKFFVLVCMAVVIFPAYIYSQSASGIIAPSRMINWSSAGVTGGIPNRTTICATLSPGASAAQINSAIASCPSDQVVYLNAGTYNLSSGIDFSGHSNVTLRGAGSDKTFLVFTGDASCNGLGADVCIAGSNSWQGGPNNTANWTGGYSKGTTQITLSNTNNLHPGSSIIVLDQLDDSSDTGGVFVCSTQGVCSTEGSGGSGRSNRAQQQIVTVTAVSGSTVTISPGLYMPNWRASQSPGAWWANQITSGDGIEDVSLDHSGSNDTTGIGFTNASNSWVKDVRSLTPNRNHVWLYIAAHITVESSYFYGTANAANESYGVEAYQSSDCLIENNIFQHITSPLVPAGTDSGTVYGYNYTIDDYRASSGNWMMAGYQPHTAGGNMSLFEGNFVNGVEIDDIHGTTDFLTFFRNRLLGQESGKTNNTMALDIEAYNRFVNVVGNVLGYPGYHKQYQDLSPNGSGCPTSIYTLGWSGQCGGTAGSVPDDPLVLSTLFRWGNYDTVTGAVRWDSTEVPSGLSLYANPVPSTQSLPASFYLSSQPSWWSTPWGTPPWPAIGPDVTGGSGPAGHSYDIPAKLCYDNTSKDSNGILNFSATGCYKSAVAPSPPTGLITTPH